MVTNANAALRWMANATPDLDDARAALTRIVKDGQRAKQIIGGIALSKRLLDQVAAAAPDIVIEPRVHSLALRLARVADGTPDVAFAGGDSHDWDLAVADLLVHEAGGALTTLDGATLSYNGATPTHGMLVAAGRPRHRALRTALCPSDALLRG
jgi:fructose-1,6-bisphosphatase/inositol monophosphatase family enzyme